MNTKAPPPLTDIATLQCLNARAFGAKGDGVTDDTASLQAALDAAAKTNGTVFVPDGVYLTSRLRLHPHTGLVGNATWSYRESSGAVLRLNDASALCLIDITGARGATLNGLSLEGKGLGSGIHAIYMGEFPEKTQEDAPRIERCYISQFTGNGIHLDPVWCFSIRSCEIISNKGHVLYVRGWDGFILDNWFSGNGGSGYASFGPNASITMTGNRIEWNAGSAIHIKGGSHYNITGNYIDRSGGPGIYLQARNGGPCLCFTITGNVIYRSGKPEWTTGSDPFDSCHARIEGAHGLVFSGNSMCVGQDDGHGKNSPNYGLVLKDLKSSIIKDNTLHIGAILELVHDMGGHDENVIIKDNVGCLLLTPEKSIWEAPQR